MHTKYVAGYHNFCRKRGICNTLNLLKNLRQNRILKFPFRYTLSPIPILQNPNFPPKYGDCGTLGISSYS